MKQKLVLLLILSLLLISSSLVASVSNTKFTASFDSASIQASDPVDTISLNVQDTIKTSYIDNEEPLSMNVTIKSGETQKTVNRSYSYELDENGAVDIKETLVLYEFDRSDFPDGKQTELNAEFRLNHPNIDEQVRTDTVLISRKIDKTSCETIYNSDNSKTSGTYTLDSGVEVYCEMNPDTSSGSLGTSGGPVEDQYTFKYIENGPTTTRIGDTNACKQNDLELFQPRGPDEYDVGRNYVIDDYGHPASDWDDDPRVDDGSSPGGGLGPLGVHINVNGESATTNPNSGVNFDSEEGRIMKSEHYGTNSLGEDNLYGQNSDGWRTKISERFWVAQSSVDDIEPNGDYDANTWLGWQNYNSDGYIDDYNDIQNGGYGYDTYLCWKAP